MQQCIYLRCIISLLCSTCWFRSSRIRFPSRFSAMLLDCSSALDPSHKQSRLSQPSSGKSHRILHRPTGPVNTFWPPSLYTVLALPGCFAVPGLAGKTMSSQASWPPSPLVMDLPGHFGPHHCTQCWLFQAAWPPSFCGDGPAVVFA